MLYELGIPVVEIDCGYHVNVHQKVPLNKDRDNVTPAYLREIQTVTLNWLAQADLIKGEDATKGWINDALASPDVKPEAVQAVIKERYGDKVVIFDPSDREGTDLAVSKGYTVLPPRTFSHDAWVNVKAAGVLPAGQVTPSPNPTPRTVARRTSSITWTTRRRWSRSRSGSKPWVISWWITRSVVGSFRSHTFTGD